MERINIDFFSCSPWKVPRPLSPEPSVAASLVGSYSFIGHPGNWGRSAQTSNDRDGIQILHHLYLGSSQHKEGQGQDPLFRDVIIQAVVHTYNLSMWEADAGGLPWLNAILGYRLRLSLINNQRKQKLKSWLKEGLLLVSQFLLLLDRSS